jgi:hypothetical protein
MYESLRVTCPCSISMYCHGGPVCLQLPCASIGTINYPLGSPSLCVCSLKGYEGHADVPQSMFPKRSLYVPYLCLERSLCGTCSCPERSLCGTCLCPERSLCGTCLFPVRPPPFFKALHISLAKISHCINRMIPLKYKQYDSCTTRAPSTAPR